MRKVHALYADDGGTGGLPVVFLHSLAGNASQWSAQLEHLRPGRRAAALEWRGHGRSGAPEDGDYSVQAAAADVSEAVDRLGIGRFVLVGHSGGGLVALQCAADHPGWVARLLLVDPAGDFKKVPGEMVDPFLSQIRSDDYPAVIEERWRSMLPGSDETVQERILDDLRSTPKETVVRFTLAQRVYDPIPALRSYPGPMLSVITHLNDNPFGLQNVYPDLPHTKVTGTGHWLQMDRPEEFNRVMDRFLASAEG